MSLKERINLVKEQLGISEVYTQALEKALKKLVDYESTEALVAALMGYYNGELKKKANTSHTHDYAPKSHTHDDRYFTESEINEKFKNFCPFPVNSLYLSLGSENPSSLWLGTTWAKQEGRFLLGSSSSYSLGSTGGASTGTLSVANLPSHTHSATTAAHTHTQPSHQHKIGVETRAGASTFANTTRYLQGGEYKYTRQDVVTPCLSAGGDTTGSASPTTSIGATGSGAAFSIMPPYLTINIWKRLS